MTAGAIGTLARRPAVRHFGPPGLLATALIAIGALGVGWLPPSSEVNGNAAVELLRTTTAGSLAARALVVIGLAMLLQAWLLLGAHVRHARTQGPAEAVSPRDLLALLVTWSVPLLLAPPMFSRDAYSYYVQGRVFASGADPTLVGVHVIPGWFDDGADPMWIESPTPYGPLFLLIERSIATIAHPNAYLGALLFRLVALAGLALVAYWLPRLASSVGADPATAMWLGLVNPLILLHFVAGAHNDALMVGLVATGLGLACQNKCIWGAVAIGLAASVKPIALVALPFVGLLWAGAHSTWGMRIRSWLMAGLVSLATIVSVLLLAGVGSGVVSATFGTPGGVITWLSPTTIVGKSAGYASTWLGWTNDDGPALALARTAGTLAVLAVIAWLALTPTRRTPLRGAALAFAALVAFGPVVQPWYLLWSLPLLAASGLSERTQRVIILLTAFFTVHAMIESSTNADNQFAAADLITFAVSAAIVLVVIFGSRSERRLIWPADDAGPHGDQRARMSA